jgi:diaminopimelate epimerase
MHGAGNDFVLVDDRAQTFPSGDSAWIRKICLRRIGIGCEGLILLQPSQSADFRMRFFNPDGAEAEMCGNGARCAARLACDIGMAASPVSIATLAGTLKADVRKDALVRIDMTCPADWRLEQTVTIDNEELCYSSVNTGVPHVVVETDALETCEVARLGGAVRRHRAFAPEGTNVNFFRATGPHSLEVRTYERGVEAETPACGTGIVAAALIAARLGRVSPPVQVKSAGADVLTVDFPPGADPVGQVSLAGPAEYVFRGEIEYPVPGA